MAETLLDEELRLRLPDALAEGRADIGSNTAEASYPAGGTSEAGAPFVPQPGVAVQASALPSVNFWQHLQQFQPPSRPVDAPSSPPHAHRLMVRRLHDIAGPQ